MIPICRAKKIDSDEYVEGFYLFDGVRHFLFVNNGNLVQTQIAPSTLAIHFPGMIDSEGTKIFASLSEDGKGGSWAEDIANQEYNATVLFQDYKICFDDEMPRDGDFQELLSRGRLKVTGIQE